MNFSKTILKELLPVEKSSTPPKGKQKRRDDVLDHLSRAGSCWSAQPICASWPSTAMAQRAKFSRNIRSTRFICWCRSRNGGAELHENFADLFFVLEGHAALVTGGTIADAKTVRLGKFAEHRSRGVSRQELRAGDVAHVPAGLPHQMLVSGDKSVTCLVLKIQQDPLEPGEANGNLERETGIEPATFSLGS